MGKILGIDLGTTNSCMAITEGGQPKVLENKEGNRTTPSVVAMSKTGERLVGQLAKRQAVTNPTNTLHSIKRLLGRRFEDAEVQEMKKHVPFEILKDGERIKVKMQDKEYALPEMSAMVLQKLKADAEEKIGEKITEAVITVPAYFDDAQRQATKAAGEIAGLKVSRIINEPTAAAFAYGFDKTKDQQVAVYDLGGGTFDISILDIAHDGDQSTVEVKSTNGDTHLGGDDFDQKIIEWILDEFKKTEGLDLSKDPLSLQRVKDAAEKVKIELSSTPESEINEPFITSGAEGPKHLNLKMTRAKLEDLVGELVERTMVPVQKALDDAGFKKEDIEEVILVGGMTRMPLVQKKVEEFFGKKPNVTVNPDEVVATGAAIQAGQLQGDLGKDILLLDVTPLSLGLETLGGVSTKLIDKNTTIPTSKSQVFSTAADNQPSVEIHVLQGERELATDNKSLGRFMLDGLPPAPRGVPQVEVTFDIDANGIVNVKAVDKATNKEQSIRIEASSGLSDEEIEKMKKEGEAHAEEDKKKREMIDVKNTADTMIYTTEKMMKDVEEKKIEITDEEKKKVEDGVEALKKALESDNIEEIKKVSEELSTSAQVIGMKMYQKEQEAAKAAGEQPAGEQPAEGEAEKKDEGEAVEGEVVDEEEKK
ncbi:MAG: molecular chaperone DnaK [Candidatus Magasanikbacteria bacterium]|jgi:molecular chaperone DnaK|nr:molecular chaperone DnaK [Candidatus Magasanikbacteria bacterium]MBT4314987.1 molecular chaperone DnaK [Candidatus Magasanikbacteria bacterium]MBT4546943.1 molecular chaperone DnaK [Candidatus Magasanikbacteria bacterium]MBT6819565.1 molecular chaperone DnaK [Candidatus Magasanikbacteria bacterium]